MTVIRQDDFIDSVADALQFISYYHPVDFVKAVHQAWQREQNPAAKDAMAQILINSRLCAEGHRPICQDTGIAAPIPIRTMCCAPPFWKTPPAPAPIPKTTPRQ
jgi:tartrate dehydratase alpha subunit/fumarate hydratase class I-like protein